MITETTRYFSLSRPIKSSDERSYLILEGPDKDFVTTELDRNCLSEDAAYVYECKDAHPGFTIEAHDLFKKEDVGKKPKNSCCTFCPGCGRDLRHDA